MNNTITTTEERAHDIIPDPQVKDADLTKEERAEIKAMLSAGVHFGHKRSLWNPAMEPYIYTIRHNLFILDVRKTERLLRKALSAVEDVIAHGGAVLFVGTQPAAKRATRSVAEEVDMPFVTERWIGGTFTNFNTIANRTRHLRDLEEKRTQGELEKYTKKEQLEFDTEIERLEEKMGGIKTMTSLPDMVVIMNVVEDEIAVREARRAGIPIVGVVDTNADPAVVEHPIPANDDAPSSVEYILGRIRKAIEQGKERAQHEAAVSQQRESESDSEAMKQ